MRPASGALLPTRRPPFREQDLSPSPGNEAVMWRCPNGDGLVAACSHGRKGTTRTQQHTPNLPLRETTVECVDEEPTPRMTFRIEELEQRLAPNVDPPSPGWGD